MEKVIVVDGQEIPLMVVAGCTRMYKLQFRRDLIRDIYKMKKLEKYIKDGELEMSDEAIAVIDFEVFSDLLWVFAKKADKTIPPPMEWEDQFTSLPFREIFPEVIHLLNILLEGLEAQKKQVAR